MENPEIIVNLWYVYDEKGLVWSLRARCYIHEGSDEEKRRFLQSVAHTDYLIAQVFPIPEKCYIEITDGQRKARIPALHCESFKIYESAAHHPAFEHVLEQLEKQLPAQTKLSIGQRPMLCVTPLFGDEAGNIAPKYDRKTRF